MRSSFEWNFSHIIHDKKVMSIYTVGIFGLETVYTENVGKFPKSRWKTHGKENPGNFRFSSGTEFRSEKLTRHQLESYTQFSDGEKYRFISDHLKPPVVIICLSSNGKAQRLLVPTIKKRTKNRNKL